MIKNITNTQNIKNIKNKIIEGNIEMRYTGYLNISFDVDGDYTVMNKLFIKFKGKHPNIINIIDNFVIKISYNGMKLEININHLNIFGDKYISHK